MRGRHRPRGRWVGVGRGRRQRHWLSRAPAQRAAARSAPGGLGLGPRHGRAAGPLARHRRGCRVQPAARGWRTAGGAGGAVLEPAVGHVPEGPGAHARFHLGPGVRGVRHGVFFQRDMQICRRRGGLLGVAPGRPELHPFAAQRLDNRLPDLRRRRKRSPATAELLRAPAEPLQHCRLVLGLDGERTGGKLLGPLLEWRVAIRVWHYRLLAAVLLESFSLGGPHSGSHPSLPLPRARALHGLRGAG
mmetsp:Transcript_91833/g.285627  ORF Transcript_91833/g.285627 Transcript_91833/m.285627 type:complete len:246 (-) Transcript_91833:135-872(-)